MLDGCYKPLLSATAVTEDFLLACQYDETPRKLAKSKRRCFALTISDLEGCYDWIIHTAAAIALLQVKIPETKMYYMFTSIQKMIHRIRTSFGDSEISYGGDDIGDWQNCTHGVLQGNTSGPTI